MEEVAGRGGQRKKVASRGGRRKKETGKGGCHEEGVWSVESDLFRSGGRRWKRVEEEPPEKVSDMLLYSWDGGLDVCVDMTGSSPLTQTGMVDFVPGRAVIDAAQRKRALTLCTSKKCGQPGCRGLQKNIEFDIHIEKEDCVKNLNLSSSPVKKGLFELPKDLHRGLEVELKKIAPVNGRVIMDFRARCGCPAVRIEVSGPKKSNRKFKK
ncbi:ribosomal protein L34e superfamily protein [Tanacetum coccineum]